MVGIGILLFPVLKKHSEQMAVGYISFRILETISCIVAAIFPLSVLALSLESQAQTKEISNLKILARTILTARVDIAGILIPLFFSLGAIIFYIFLYQTKLLPRFISVWGLIGIALILLLNLLNIKSSAGMILALPIILNEIFLGIWLIVKGFRPVAIHA